MVADNSLHACIVFARLVHYLRRSVSVCMSSYQIIWL